MNPQNKDTTNSCWSFHAILPIQPQRRDEFLTIMIQIQKETVEKYKQSLVSFVIGEDIDTPNLFHVYEEYNTATAVGDDDKEKEMPTQFSTHHAPLWNEFRDSSPTSPLTSHPLFSKGTNHQYNNNNNKNQESLQQQEPVRDVCCVYSEYHVKEENVSEFRKQVQEYQTQTMETESHVVQFVWGPKTTTTSTNIYYLHEQYSGNYKGMEGLILHEQTQHYQAFQKFCGSFVKNTSPFQSYPVIHKYTSIPMNPNNKNIWKENVWKLENGEMETVVELEQEPRHHIDFTNKYTRNITIRMKPGESTMAHRHEIDTVVFILMKNGIDFINNVMGCGSTKGHMNFGQVGYSPFTKEPCVHKITNLSPDNMLVINHEILINYTKLPPPVVQEQPLTCKNHTLVMEKHNCRVYKCTLQPKESIEDIVYNFYYTRILLSETGGNLKTEQQTTIKQDEATYELVSIEKDLKMGDCHPFDANEHPLKLTNMGDTVLEYYICELKGIPTTTDTHKRPLVEVSNETAAKKIKTH